MERRVTLKGHVSRKEARTAEIVKDLECGNASEVSTMITQLQTYEPQLIEIHHTILKEYGDSEAETKEHEDLMARIHRLERDLRVVLREYQKEVPQAASGREPSPLPIISDAPTEGRPLHTGAIPKILQPSLLDHLDSEPPNLHPGIDVGLPPTPGKTTLESALAYLMEHQAKAEERTQRMFEHFRESLGSPRSGSFSPHAAGESFHCKLPTLTIPEFNGDHTAWYNFKDMFVSIVHQNPRLSNIQRLQYLMTAVTGTAKRLVANISLTDRNYIIAWDALCAHYDDQHAIVHHHVEKLNKMAAVSAPTVSNFTDLYTTTSSVLNSLDALDQTNRDPWIIYLLLSKLDHESKVLWSREVGSRQPTLSRFMLFMKDRLRSLEVCQATPGPKPADHGSKGNTGKPPQKSGKSNVLATTAESACPACKATDHRVFKCPKFLRMSPADRLALIREKGLCRKCLVSTHMTKDCSFGTCTTCAGHHNKLLHEAFRPNAPQPATGAKAQEKTQPAIPPSVSTPPQTNDKKEEAAVCSSLTEPSAPRKIFLETAVVHILDRHGVPTQCRALLDSGAQANLLSQSLFQKLKLPKCISTLFIGGVVDGGTKAKYQTECTVRSLHNSKYFSMTCQVVPSILQQDIPNWCVSPASVPIPGYMELADPTWHVSQPIDLLIGNEFYNDVVSGKVLRLGAQLPVLKESVFGWIISGPCTVPPAEPAAPQVVAATTLSSIDTSIRKLWVTEQVEAPRSTCPDHFAAEKIYKETTTRDDTGRYVVHLPLKPNVDRLHNNLFNASRQLLSLEKRLEQNSELKAQYHAAMQENLDLGFFEEVPPDEMHRPSYYMPHHCVVKISGSSIKIRIVMNASSKSLTGLSFNDVTMIGPTVQPDIVTNLLRFREHQFAFSCDIKKMYPQILIHPPHRDYLRILWRFDTNEPIKHYRARGVCFGVSSSPFLATRTLMELAEIASKTHPLASELLRKHFYVDDCLASVRTLEEAQRAVQELTELLATAGMSLSKWNASHSSILPQSSAEEVLDVLPDASATLGMIWQKTQDRLSFKWKRESPSVHTKRVVLSVLASLYDPLGLLGPVVILGKLLMQAIWQMKIGWDEQVPEPILGKWLNLLASLPSVQDISIPRWMSFSIQSTIREVHIFADSSNVAYGAVAYLVTGDSRTQRISHLMVAKSHVAPAEPTTIPKLELCAALLGAKLLSKIRSSIEVTDYHMWSDSTSVLGQIRSKKMKLEPYFLNRVTQILALTDAGKWHYVPTAVNPADIISRGMYPHELKESNLWWHGPEFLTMEVDAWPRDPSRNEPETAEVLALPAAPAVEEKHPLDSILASSNDYRRILRVVAYVFRFLSAIRSKPRENGPITACELDHAEQTLVKFTQDVHLSELGNALADGSLYRTGKLKPLQGLSPFLDHLGIIRVGGRLDEGAESYDFKHPMLVPKSRLAYLIALHVHQDQMHPGPQLLLALVSHKFWLLGGRRLTRSVSRNCVVCWRQRPTMLAQRMGNLPTERISYESAFAVCNVDFCGPVLTRPAYKRGGVSYKTYICAFVCSATKAVHLEVLGDMTTSSFLAALTRFCSRRSAPRKIFCDNGKNLVGADAALKKLFHDLQSQPQMQNECSNRGITFQFIPPRSPHHGGLHEAAIKSLKHHLRREIGTTILTFEELSTVISQIEAILNSRPLTPLPAGPDEQPALCPGHFTTLKPLVMMPSQDFTNINPGLLTRWQLCQKLLQQFAIRWKKEYLQTLQRRNKWTKEEENIKPGDVVLISEDDMPPYAWPLAVVDQVHPGRDGKCRVATVRTAKGVYTRAVQKLSKLPIDEGLPPSGSPPPQHVDALARQRDQRCNAP
ncbi:uncharacterized protein LOC129788348 [Lutzomyia longipalpis]|uniref:uncharacterized protein LOC129788348 n=1 Tax=Lutzomyia longipalpis TaxID=7200 RepID=UPI0024839B79|nr:uncharacterized protein LOC129788348 [Lutzomyia longipalpis]